jgi:hypothetical protein
MSNTLKVTLDVEKLTLRPGDTAELQATIENGSSIVQHYGTSVLGLPSGDCYDADPAVTKLRPGEAASVRVRISIPERAELHAGRYTLGVLVRSQYQSDVSRCEELPLDIVPVQALSIAAQPEVATGGPTATYALRVTNDGNTPLAVSLSGSDPEDKVRFSFRPRALQLPTGTTAPAQLTVRAPVPWTGQELRRSLTVRAEARPDVTVERQVAFVQHPRVAGKALRVAGIAAGVAVLAGASIAGPLLLRSARDATKAQASNPGASTSAPSLTPSQTATNGSPDPTETATETAAPPVGKPTVVDFTHLPDGGPPGDRIIEGDAYTGVSLSTVTDGAPVECEDATALALRTVSGFGSFLTSARPAGVDLCNTLPVHIAFDKPAQKFALTFAGVGAEYLITVEFADNPAEDVSAAEELRATPQRGTVSTIPYTAPAGTAVASLTFGHADPDPAAKVPTIIKRVEFTPAQTN